MEHITDGHVVVGKDGAIYTIQQNYTLQKAYSSCNLLNSLIWYNKHLQFQNKVEVTHDDAELIQKISH